MVEHLPLEWEVQMPIPVSYRQHLKGSPTYTEKVLLFYIKCHLRNNAFYIKSYDHVDRKTMQNVKSFDVSYMLFVNIVF